MEKSPRDVYLELAGKPLEGFNDWFARDTFQSEVSRLRGSSLFTDDLKEYSRLLKNNFQPLSLADYLSPMNEILANIYSEIEQELELPALANHKQKFLANNNEVFVAAFPLTSVNAEVNQIDRGKHLILLNMGLIHTVYILAKLSTSQLRVSRDVPRDWEPKITLDQIRDYLSKYFAKYVETKGEVPIADHLDVPWEESQVHFLSWMIKHAEKFIIGHELGHIMNGHMTTEHLKRKMLAKTSVEVYEGNYELEYEADRSGFDLAFANFPPEDEIDDIYLRAAIAGVNLVFRTIEALEKLFNVTSTTHPPAYMRRYEFMSFIRGRYMERNLFISNRIDFLLDYELLKYAIPG